MSFNATTLLEVLRVFLVLVGGLVTAWGVYDLFGDSGQQSSVGVKKLMGGIAFAAISALLMTWAISDVGGAMGQAGLGMLTRGIPLFPMR